MDFSKMLGNFAFSLNSDSVLNKTWFSSVSRAPLAASLADTRFLEHEKVAINTHSYFVVRRLFHQGSGGFYTLS